jgi:hypothetical protein
MKAKFDSKIAKFEAKAQHSIAGVATAKGVARDVKGKLAMFEEVGKAPVSNVRKTWKAGPGTSYRKKTEIDGGPVGKKSLADLP